jgi:hypothetical protein
VVRSVTVDQDADLVVFVICVPPKMTAAFYDGDPSTAVRREALRHNAAGKADPHDEIVERNGRDAGATILPNRELQRLSLCRLV